MDAWGNLLGWLLAIAMVLGVIYSTAVFVVRLPSRWRRAKDRRMQAKHRNEVLFTIRPFVDADASAVVDLAAKLNRKGWRILDRNVAHSRLEPANRQQTGFLVFVAEQKGAIAGYAGVQIVPLGTYSETAYLTELFVLPEYRRSGIATALFETVATKAREHKAAFVRWHVQRGDKEALAFYRAAGAIWDPFPQMAVPTWAFLRAGLRKRPPPPTDAPEWWTEVDECDGHMDLAGKPTE